MTEYEHIARISYGKDSLKMLEVIKSRGLPLDRITTTDVWATDTISANLPPMEQFKARMDQKIWDIYRIEVEHLCARNPDGTKRTYEQMFYHVPVRKSGGGGQPRDDQRISDSVVSLVPRGTQNGCQNTEYREPSWDSRRTPGTTGARSSKFAGGGVQGIPNGNGSYLVSETQNQSETRGFRRRYLHGAENSRSTRSKPLFH